jgi:hypothetical protein
LGTWPSGNATARAWRVSPASVGGAELGGTHSAPPHRCSGLVSTQSVAPFWGLEVAFGSRPPVESATTVSIDRDAAPSYPSGERLQPHPTEKWGRRRTHPSAPGTTNGSRLGHYFSPGARHEPSRSCLQSAQSPVRPPRTARYGWQAANGTVVHDAVQQLVIARIRAWDAEGMSAGTIARRLNAARTPGPRGQRWSARLVKQVLRWSRIAHQLAG